MSEPDTKQDWREAHMDGLAERAVKAEMLNRELLAALHRVVEQFGHTHKDLYAIEKAWEAIGKAEGRA